MARYLLSLTGLLLLTACKTPTASEQLQTIGSWLSTADLAADSWLNHTTPDKYTRQTVELTHESLRQTSSELLASRPPGVDSAFLDSLLTRSTGRVAQLGRFIEARDAPDLRRELDSLRAETRLVKTLADSLEKSH